MIGFGGRKTSSAESLPTDVSGGDVMGLGLSRPCSASALPE